MSPITKLGKWARTTFWAKNNGHPVVLILEQEHGEAYLNSAEVAVIAAFAAAAGIEAEPELRKLLVTRCKRAGMETSEVTICQSE